MKGLKCSDFIIKVTTLYINVEKWFWGTWALSLCSRVTLSRQCMYWPCQRGYLFGELVTYSPVKREVPGSTGPAGAVSHCYMAPATRTTRGQQCLYMYRIVVARGRHRLYRCCIVVIWRPLWPRSLGLGPSHYYKKRQVCKRVSTSKIRHCFFPTQNPLWETNVVSKWPEKCKV